MELHQLMMPTAPPIPLDPLLEAALARKNLWESNRRAPKGLSVILPDGYELSNDSPLGMIPIDDEPSDPENEEKEEVFKILMICGAVLFLFLLILIILRVLILLKSCQHKALKKEQEKQNKKLEALKIQIER